MERAYREPAIRFTACIREVGSKNKPWEEEFIEETDDPEAWIKERCEEFNTSLKDGEVLREVVYIIRRGRCPAVHHKWEKQNLITIQQRGGRFYDEYRCARCGCTAKRYGITGGITRDEKYQKREYERCDTAVELQQKTYKSLARKVMAEDEAKETKRREAQELRAARKLWSKKRRRKL